ncbi:MAG: class I tRNA ligase family protein, partial [Acidobacteriota bacterium]
MAPAFGEEDAQVGEREHLPVLRTVDTDGTFIQTLREWGEFAAKLAGRPIFAANAVIIEELDRRGQLLKKGLYRHSYPFCWRCDTPLIYYALDTWFLRVAELKEDMLATNEQIHWIPKHVKHGRFGKGIEAAPDWAISRNRFWSVPLPIWQCESCEEYVCIGSAEELRQLSGADESIQDIHRPYVDRVTWPCKTCQGTMRRVPEVLDVWFDSGSMPYSSWHYPFEHKEFVEKGFPADLIAESIEMTRAWFYVLHVISTALTRKEADTGLPSRSPAFLNAIASGLIFAEDGQKLSKKLKNYPDIESTLQQYGADSLRLYLLTSASLGEPYRFSENDLRKLRQNVYMRLWNVYSFFVRYATIHGWSLQESVASDHILDRWIIARTAQFEGDLSREMNSYQIDAAARLFSPFVDDVSNWYVRRSRGRFQ